MTCKPISPAWAVAIPFMPFLAAAWVGGAALRHGGRCWTISESEEDDHPKTSTRRARSRDDIVETASAAGSFETLVNAVKVAGLVETLRGDGPFTVFAPTDDAFDRLPEGALDELLQDEEKLASVLTFHVVPGHFGASALDGVAALKTVQGQSLAVDTSLGTKVGSAYVIQPDIETSNGVIHAIDSVLLPGEKDV